MLLHQLKSDFKKQLADLYPKTEIQSFFNRLCHFKLDLKRVDLVLNPNKIILPNHVLFFKEAIERLKKQEPIQYIIGTTEFYGLSFKVNKHVLIPRPETEELVAWILEEVGNQKINSNVTLSAEERPPSKPLNILDIGTGSGCIAIALAKNLPQAKVWALDVSKEALKIAQQNAEGNRVKINFVEADILKSTVIASKAWQSITNQEITTVAPLLRKDKNDVTLNETELSLPQYFDIIVSNPPYVKQDEKPLMQPNVLAHEPHLALFVADNNPLIFYDKIADFASHFLNKSGKLFFEINQSLAQEICVLLKTKGFTNISLKKDLFEVYGMVKAQKL